MLRIYTVIIVDFVWEIPPLLFTEMPAHGQLCLIISEKLCIQALFQALCQFSVTSLNE